MVCLMSVSEDRKADIRVAEKVFTTPIIATTTYVDSFGNRCRRLVAPSGDLTIWATPRLKTMARLTRRTLPRRKFLSQSYPARQARRHRERPGQKQERRPPRGKRSLGNPRAIDVLLASKGPPQIAGPSENIRASLSNQKLPEGKGEGNGFVAKCGACRAVRRRCGRSVADRAQLTGKISTFSTTGALFPPRPTFPNRPAPA